MREEGRGRTSKVAGRKSKVQGPVGEGGRKVNQGGSEGVRERRWWRNQIGTEGVREKGKAARLRSANYGEVKGQSWLAGWRARAASQAAGDAGFKRK